MSTGGVRRFELRDKGNEGAQQAGRARASAAAAVANADSSREQSYRCLTTLHLVCCGAEALVLDSIHSVAQSLQVMVLNLCKEPMQA